MGFLAVYILFSFVELSVGIEVLLLEAESSLHSRRLLS